MPVDPISLARLRAKTGLKLPECVVLSTATWHHLSVFTFDERLAAASADIAAD